MVRRPRRTTALFAGRVLQFDETAGLIKGAVNGGGKDDDGAVPRDNQGETAASIRMRMRRGWTAVARA